MKYSLVVSSPNIFMMLHTSLLLSSQQIQASFTAKHRQVDKCIRTTGTPCFGWSKWPCVVHGQRTLSCFVGFIAELKVASWLETTLRQLFKDWLSVMWTSTSHLLFTSLVSYCFVSSGHHVLLKFGLQDTLSNKMEKKKMQHCKRRPTSWWHGNQHILHNI